MTPDSRAKAWQTRREKYGPHGHSGVPYDRPAGANEAKMLRFIIGLHRDGTISEGQASKATGLDRIKIRELADKHPTTERN